MNWGSFLLVLSLGKHIYVTGYKIKDVVNEVNTQQASWGPCPTNQLVYGTGYLRDCITLQFPLDRSNLSLGNVNAFLRRFYVGSSPTNTSLWLVEGGPGFSTRPFIPVANYFLSQNSNLTAYLLDARGTGLSSLLTCNHSNVNPGFYFNPYNQSEVNQYANCNQEIITLYGNITKYYSSYHSVLDFADSITFINPATVSIYALSYGTFFINEYLQLPNARVDCVILDGPIPPNRWVLEDSAMMNSWVSQNVLNLCTMNSSVCSNALGEMGQLPQLIMQAVIERTLPCNQKMSWLNATDGHLRTAQFTNFMTATQSAQALLAPFWYRLYRCSESDIEQLNHFYEVRMNQMYPNVMSVYDYSYGLGTNIATNELYSFEGNNTTLTYEEEILITNRLFSTGGGELTISYAIYESNFPKYSPNPLTYLQFANVTIPILILVGTLDANTIQGLGVWFQNGLGSDNATLITVPYATHGTVNQEDLCVDGIVTNFINTLGQGDINTTCLSTLLPPDFDGSEFTTQSLAFEYFGTTDLWNNGYLKDVPPDTVICPTTDNDDNAIVNNDCENDWSEADVNNLIIAIVIPFSLVMVGCFVYIVYLLKIIQGFRKPPLASELHTY